MKIKANFENGESKEIELKIFGRHTKKVLKLMSSINEGTESDTPLEFFDELDKIAQKCADLTDEEMETIDADDKNKIINAIQEKAYASITFLKSSLK
jgi:hypothetical protein